MSEMKTPASTGSVINTGIRLGWYQRPPTCRAVARALARPAERPDVYPTDLPARLATAAVVLPCVLRRDIEACAAVAVRAPLLRLSPVS
jgi:hypothetical protein